MDGMRKNDVVPYSKLRASRFFKEAGGWCFHTREGAPQGPYADMREAQARLAVYLQIFEGLDMIVPAGDVVSPFVWRTGMPVEMLWR